MFLTSHHSRTTVVECDARPTTGQPQEQRAPGSSITGQCTPQETSITLDGNWMWTHKVGQPQNCYTGDNWFVTQQPLCPPRRDWNGKHWKKEKYLKNSTQGPDVVPGPSDVCPKLCSGRWRLRKHVRNFNVGQHHVAEICDERPRLARAQCGIEELPP
eukprot:m.208902 g.208902  ORF g.208902 m.208902 type:complete len:158 (+) comp15460_c0_seq8:124-597(+)